MIHIGASSFYDEVGSLLDQCHLILWEGVSSLRARILTFSYRWVVQRRRLGLVLQHRALPRERFEGRLIHSDVSSEEFHREWSQVPLYIRLVFYVGAPLCGAYVYLRGTRASIARRLALDDLPSREEALLWDEDFESVDHALVTARDQKLLANALRCFQERQAEHQLVGIVYGAAHMRAVLRLLQERLGYRVVDARWVTVFNL